MRNLSLDFFNLPRERKYHIHRIDSSLLAEQSHSHDFYQICYIECGHIEHWLDDTPVLLGAGDAFIVPPGCIHKIVFPEKNVFVYSLSFDEALFHPGFSHSNVYHFLTALKLETLEAERIPIRTKVVLDTGRRQTLLGLMEALLREQESTCPPSLAAAGSLVAAVVCILSQGYFLDDANRHRLQDMAEYIKTMENCVSYIDTHFTQSLNLNDLARRFALSRSKFSLLFPQYTGTTLKRYIAKKRIDYAVTLTRTTTLSIQEIAAMVGYEDLSTFYRNFTKVTGAPPSAFRPDMQE